MGGPGWGFSLILREPPKNKQKTIKSSDIDTTLSFVPPVYNVLKYFI